jgi:hypothetical protein
MVSRRNRTLLSLSIFLGVLAWNVAAAAVKGETGTPAGSLSAHEIEEQLQVSYTFVVYGMEPCCPCTVQNPK